MVNKTSSTHKSVAVTGVHRFTVAGQSALNSTGTIIKSASFRVDGHDWAIEYRPDGHKVDDKKHVSVYLTLLSDAAVTASLSFCLVDPASTTAGINIKSGRGEFSSARPTWGYTRYMSKADLAASGCIKDDSLVIKCTVTIVTSKLISDNEKEEDTGVAVVVPPSNLENQLAGLLEAEDATNMTKDLLIVADRYGIEKLKLICERKLSMVLDVDTVCCTLEFAERHSCQQLKNCCLAYVVKDRDRLKAIVKTQGFKQLNQNCPSMASEILVKSLHID